jgi:hypothetical protein
MPATRKRCRQAPGRIASCHPDVKVAFAEWRR